MWLCSLGIITATISVAFSLVLVMNAFAGKPQFLIFPLVGLVASSLFGFCSANIAEVLIDGRSASNGDPKFLVNNSANVVR